jgi:hypothetical protein
MADIDNDDYTLPLEAVMASERRRSLPLKRIDCMELFDEWVSLNPEAMRDIELAAIAIDARGMRVSAKYLIERERYESGIKLNPVTFYDDNGNQHTYGISNTITPLLARWLLKRHPGMRVITKKSFFDDEEGDGDEE